MATLLVKTCSEAPVSVRLMKKLFVQFYLLLFVCFLVMTMLVGLVYKFTAERAGRQSLDDLMKSSLYLMRSELRKYHLMTGRAR